MVRSQAEAEEMTLPATLPPSTTNAKGQTKAIFQAGYPMALQRCPHELAYARRLGNKHGRFLECTACGKIKKALDKDYQIPNTETQVPVYAINHGVRKHPGGKITPVERDQFSQTSWDNLVSSYALSSSSASATLTPQPKAKAKVKSGSTTRPATKAASSNPYVMNLEDSPPSATWEEITVPDSDEEMG